MNTIKVKTEVLVAKSASLQSKTADMRTQFGELESIVNKTANYWIGEAGDKKRMDYLNKRDRVEELLKRLEEYPKDLLQMAGIYAEAESTNTGVAEALAADVII